MVEYNKKKLNEMNSSPRILYPAKLSLKLEGTIHYFSDKQKLRNFIDSKPNVKEGLKRLIKDKEEPYKNNKHYRKMAQNPMTIISLNVNGLNAPIKRHRVEKWIRKLNPTFCCLQETHLNSQNAHRLRVKGWKQSCKQTTPSKKLGWPY